jgi:hypothetical protein
MARGFALAVIGGLLLWSIAFVAWNDPTPIYHLLRALVPW